MKIIQEEIIDLEELDAPALRKQIRKQIEKNRYIMIITWMLILGTILGIMIGTIIEDSWYQNNWQPKTEITK